MLTDFSNHLNNVNVPCVEVYAGYELSLGIWSLYRARKNAVNTRITWSWRVAFMPQNTEPLLGRLES